MPILCFDEKDYWGFYFDRFKVEKKVVEAFERMKEHQVVCIYISYRFNAKEYLDEIAH